MTVFFILVKFSVAVLFQVMPCATDRERFAKQMFS